VPAAKSVSSALQFLREHIMEKSGSFSQANRIIRNTGTDAARKVNDSNDINQKMRVDDAHYHDEKLGLGRHGAHEGWVKAEEANMAAKQGVSAETRHQMIAFDAYYRAEKRGFKGQGALQDWIKAESEIDAMLQDRIEHPQL
jgi:hypothetical protein